jgi:hypothetical protein
MIVAVDAVARRKRLPGHERGCQRYGRSIRIRRYPRDDEPDHGRALARHTDRADLEIYDGPDTDVSGTQTVATVVCGGASGKLDRVVSRDEDGWLVTDRSI